MSRSREVRRTGGAVAAGLLTLCLGCLPVQPAQADTFYVGSETTGGLAEFWGFGVRSTIFRDDLPPAPLSQPRDLVVSPDGQTIYAVTGDSLTAVDRETRALRTPVPVGAGPGSRLAITPDGRTALVTSPSGDRLTPVDTVSNAAGAPIALSHPTDFVVTPDGRAAYVLTAGSNLTPVDLTTGTPKAPITLSHPGAAVAVTADGALAVVAESEAQDTGAPGPSALQVIHLADGTTEPPISLADDGVSALELTADGGTAYVALGGGMIVPFDVGARLVGSALPSVRRDPNGATQTVTDLAVTLDGKHLLGTIPCPACASSAVVQINFHEPYYPPPGSSEPGTTVTSFGAGTSPGAREAPSSIVRAPDPGLLLFDNGAQHMPHPQMDLVHTLSVAAWNWGGKVSGVSWDFGDGTRTETADVTVDHAFPRYGVYQVTTTATFAGGCAAKVVYTGHTAACSGRTTARASKTIAVAPVPIPLHATSGPTGTLTTTSAVLNGTVGLEGSPATWRFDYGATGRYGHYVRGEDIPAGEGAIPVTRTLRGLKPNATYHYRLVADTPAGQSTGEDVSFTTRATGRIPLRSNTLLRSGTRAVAALRCASLKPCRGHLTLTVRVRDSRHRLVTRTCGRATFSVRAGRSARVTIPLSAACRVRLRHAPKGRLTATLTGRTITGQSDLSARVRLRR